MDRRRSHPMDIQCARHHHKLVACDYRIYVETVVLSFSIQLDDKIVLKWFRRRSSC